MTTPRRYKGWAALVGVCLLIAGCTQPTFYRPASNGFGYAEKQIADDRYQVVFAGNHNTRRETAHQFVLFRAAELAHQQGYDYVAVNGQSQRIERFGDLFDRPTQRVDLGLEEDGGRSGFGSSNDEDRIRSSVERYQAILDVSFYNDEESIPEEAREIYTTEQVLEEVGPSIEFESGPPPENYVLSGFGDLPRFGN